MKVITFAALKGGVGKSSLTFQVGATLAMINKKILIIDGDTQGNVSTNVGFDRTENPNQLTMDSIFSTSPPLPQDVIIENPNPHLPNLDLIASSIFMHALEGQLIVETAREQKLKKYFSLHAEYFKKYDYVLIDTNPSMSILNQNAFVLSDSILLVGDLTIHALDGQLMFMALWDNTLDALELEDNIKGSIINNFDIRERISKSGLEKLDSSPKYAAIKSLILDTRIPKNTAIPQSEQNNIPVIVTNSNSQGSQAYTDLIAELFNKNIL